ncbi:MAG TPA: AAA domain-containing protein [Actinomycetes bacterium]
MLVSHTNAAVDQALLRIADEVDLAELERGLVIRLGETKERMVAERPELLAQTHIERRSLTLIQEQDALQAERAERTGRLSEVERLLEIATWLPRATAEFPARHFQLEQVEQLERAAAEALGRLESLEAELAPFAVMGQEAEQALALARRAAELQPELAQATMRHHAATSALAELAARRESAEALAARARNYAPVVRAAEARLAELRAELPKREPLLAATDAELDEFRRSITEAKEHLERAEAASALTRRLRGLPRPDDQRQRLASLQARAERLAQARQQTAQAIEGLEREFREAQEFIVRFGHLPEPDLARQQADDLRDREEQARAALGAAEDEERRLVGELAWIGDPEALFEATYGRPAADIVVVTRELRQRIRPVAREVQLLAAQARQRREVTARALVERLADLRRLGLSLQQPETLNGMVAEVERAYDEAQGLLAGTSMALLEQEQGNLQQRLRVIAARLAEIDEELKRVEELVIAEASVVATTLARAYKRESVQQRTFDTVILDEASMAPIPALWVVAARAERNVVLVGDFRQLPPIKHSSHELADRWLGRDVFEVAGIQGAVEAGAAPSHLLELREQRRMHPAISHIANRFIYDGRLRDGVTPSDAELLGGWFNADWGADAPVLLVDTASLNAWVTSVSRGGRTSRQNFLSATVCADLAEFLLLPDRPAFKPGERPRIILGAPYRPQAKLLGLLAREQGLAGEVVAGTAHTFQGNEAPVVIFDLVNDEPHWRVGMFDPRRDEGTRRLLNVALTRAQRRLIIAGDFAWIERQAGRGGFLRRLVAELKATYPLVEARTILPDGFAGRAAAAQRSSLATQPEPVPPQLVVTQERFFDQLHADLAAARHRIVIYSPFATLERVGRLEPHLRGAVERGVEVWVVTKTLEERGRDRQLYEQIERGLRSWGISVAHKRHMHEKLVLIDDDVLWQGSLNPLSYSATQEVMERRQNREIAGDYASVLRLGEFLGAYGAGQTTCPYCGSEVVAAEGRDDPYYWRCVADDCFSRSIGDPMPVDGRVVCRRCQGKLEFRWPSEEPFWRCTDNHHHRQPLARSHLRLPRMRELIPAHELRTLDRQFGIESTAARVRRSL